MRIVSELWSATCDFGTHLCKVDRLEDRTAILSIFLVGSGPIHTQPVTVNNSDHDVDDWQELCEAILDDPDRWNRAA